MHKSSKGSRRAVGESVRHAPLVVLLGNFALALLVGPEAAYMLLVIFMLGNLVREPRRVDDLIGLSVGSTADAASFGFG